MWVTKLLIFPVKKRIFCPKATKFSPKLALLSIAGSFGALLLGRLVVVARGLYLARHLFTLSFIFHSLQQQSLNLSQMAMNENPRNSPRDPPNSAMREVNGQRRISSSVHVLLDAPQNTIHPDIRAQREFPIPGILVRISPIFSHSTMRNDFFSRTDLDTLD